MFFEKIAKRLHIYFLLLIFCLMSLLPFFWMFITAVKTTRDLVSGASPLALPEIWHWDNYINAWISGRFNIYFKNSVLVAAFTVAGVLLLSILASYVFSYHTFAFKNFWFTLVLLGLMVPGELVIIPLFHNLHKAGVLNTFWAVILPQIASNIPFGTFLLRGFMKDIPRPLLESARIDGSSEVENLVYIVIPLITPAIIALLIFTAMGSWNSFFLPTIMLQNDNLKTLPLGLNFFRTKYTTDFPMTMAAANIIAAPVVVIYLIFQRNIIQGMMIGALKE